MQEKMFSFWTRFLRCEAGVTLVEYGIAVALAILIGATAFTLLAGDITGAMNAAGATAPRASRPTLAPTAHTMGPTTEGFFFAATGAGAGLGLTGAIDSFGAGGGHVVASSLQTVAPRITSSSMFTTIWPSFSGVRSVSKCRRFVA